jgi:hypothetical protein
MIRWFRRWRREQERGIFHFWDGRDERRADPLVVWRELNADPEFSLVKHPELIDAGDLDAMRIGAAAVRRSLQIPTFDEGGLTEQECLNLLIDFFEYTAALKKNTSPLPTPPSPTESSSPLPYAAESSTTKPAVESSSAETAPNADTARASCSESATR